MWSNVFGSYSSKSDATFVIFETLACIILNVLLYNSCETKAWTVWILFYSIRNIYFLLTSDGRSDTDGLEDDQIALLTEIMKNSWSYSQEFRLKTRNYPTNKRQKSKSTSFMYLFKINVYIFWTYTGTSSKCKIKKLFFWKGIKKPNCCDILTYIGGS